jgi:hypothetical protein
MWRWFPILLAGCGTSAVSADDALFARLPEAEVLGCLEAHFGALVRGDDTHLMLRGSLDLDPERVRTEPYAAGEVFTVDLDEGARLTALVGPDLSQNWPCNHLPFEPDRIGEGTVGTISLTVLGQADVAAAGGRLLTADVAIRDARIRMEDGLERDLPDLDYDGVRFALDSE